MEVFAMRYISDDGKVFNTEQECLKYERKLEEERVKKEKLEMERQSRLDFISKSMKIYRKIYLNLRKIMVIQEQVI